LRERQSFKRLSFVNHGGTETRRTKHISCFRASVFLW
jgi:hypothetical protein